MTKTILRIAVSVMCLACVPTESDGCWNMIVQSAIVDCAPIIVTGEIVHIDVAKGVTTEGRRSRYLDQAHIRIDKVHKNVLADVKVTVKGSISAWMHSSNATIPGSETGGQQTELCVSTDLRYPVGKQAVWHLFLDPDGRFVIHRHPQQCLPIDEAKPIAVGNEVRVLTKNGEEARGMTANEWARERLSELNRSERVKKKCDDR